MNASNHPPAVSCNSVRKSFGQGETMVEVLRGADFTAAQGEITFLVGPSGCGKTTLISVIAGLLNPGAGEVHVLGHRIHEMKPQDQVRFRRQHLGFVFQQYNLLPALTAAENAAVPLLAAGMKKTEAVERARALLARLGLESKASHYPAALSGGQQQRVALARALVHEPRLVVCDEPTAALDHKSGESVMELLSSAAVHPDRAVVVVTHDNRVFHYAHRISHMDDGVITHTQVTQTQLNAS